jgi:hypothetical protein
MSETDQDSPAANKSNRTKWIVIAGVIVFIGMSFKFLLPKSFSDDLSRIGKGLPAVVLIRDNQTVQSHELIDAMNAVRDRYTGKVEFLLTDHNTPEGSNFMAANDATRATLVLFTGVGTRVRNLQAPQTEDSLSHEIDNLLGTAK